MNLNQSTSLQKIVVVLCVLHLQSEQDIIDGHKIL